ncbi:MAG: Gfo/Idh/MocA family oxidoreductase [Pirellulales bacterium]|nr:Gfo/Idh/MocA family oxidoreductase [Pirellulales bacterium]
MNLTPEQREIGKQNFYEAVGTTRRDFLKGTVLAAGTATASLGAMYFGYGGSVEKPLRVGIIGTGDEGSVLIGSLNPQYVDVVAIADIRPYNQHRAFHGDQDNLAARPGLMSIYDWKSEDEARKHVKVYTGAYDELINDRDVEAVIIALPLWLHHTAAFKAMQAGKHVLCEKLMAQTVGHCKEMGRMAAAAKAADGSPIMLAVGHQRHYSILYANAVDQIRRGLMGDLHHIRAQWHRGNLPGSDSWSPPLPAEMISESELNNLRREARAKGAEEAVLEEYKLLLQLFSLQKRLDGLVKSNSKDIAAVQALEAQVAQKKKQLEDVTVDAAKYGYEEKTTKSGYRCSPLEELIRWRLWDRTAAGLMAELGSHQLDASSIFVSSQRDDGGKVYPIAVQGVGIRSIFPADRDVDDHVHCNFEFPAVGYYEDIKTQDKVANPDKKIVVSYSSINGNGFGGYGEVVMGTKGTLILDREQEALLFAGDANTKIEVKEGKDGKPAMSTYETGGGAAVAQAATPKNVSRGYREEIEHWAWCIRNPTPEHQPKCGPKVAMADAIIALASNIAMKQGKRIEFRHEWFDLDKDDTPEVDLGVEGAQGPRQAGELV